MSEYENKLMRAIMNEDVKIYFIFIEYESCNLEKK